METETSRDLLDLEVGVEVWLAEERVPLERLIELGPGESLELQKDPDEPVDLLVNGTVIAKGELVIVDGHFAVRVISTQLGDLDTEQIANEAAEADADAGAANEESGDA